MIAAGMLPADVPPDFGYVTDAAQKEAMAKLAKFVPKAKHIVPEHDVLFGAHPNTAPVSFECHRVAR